LAEYADGHTVKEPDCSYANLDRNGISRFSLYDEKKKIATLKVDNDKVFFYRIRTFNATMPTQFRVWLLGWRTKNDLHFILLHENGAREEYGKWGTTPLTLEPQWLPEEKV
jgi:hypothetical protein